MNDEDLEGFSLFDVNDMDPFPWVALAFVLVCVLGAVPFLLWASYSLAVAMVPAMSLSLYLLIISPVLLAALIVGIVVGLFR